MEGCPEEEWTKDTLVSGPNAMENAHLAVTINEDGTLNVLDKALGRTYENLCYFEDTLDAGNEYIYFCPEGNEPILTKGTKASVQLVEDTPIKAVYEIINQMTVPVSADEQLKLEQESVVPVPDRTCGRSSRMVQMELHTFVTLEKDARSLTFKTVFDNTAKDHRIRVIVPTGLTSKWHYAESVFEVAKRPNEHSKVWENPCKCEHQQSFVGMEDEKGGLLVANIGLYEYEILPGQDNAMAVTLVRCVGELGDWGVFKTELSQQQRRLEAEYALTFFEGDLVEADGYRWAHQFQIPVTAEQTGIHNGQMPAGNRFLEWCGAQMVFSGMKGKDESNDVMVRFFNCGEEDSVLYITKIPYFTELYFSNVLEEELRLLLPDENGIYEIPVRGYEIITIGLKK